MGYSQCTFKLAHVLLVTASSGSLHSEDLWVPRAADVASCIRAVGLCFVSLCWKTSKLTAWMPHSTSSIGHALSFWAQLSVNINFWNMLSHSLLFIVAVSSATTVREIAFQNKTYLQPDHPCVSDCSPSPCFPCFWPLSSFFNCWNQGLYTIFESMNQCLPKGSAVVVGKWLSQGLQTRMAKT